MEHSSVGEQDMENVLRTQKAREDRGFYEFEVSCNGEADLHQHLNSCPKNPGHSSFIPIKDFKLDHLPPAYRDSKIADMVGVISDLTVRLAVRHTSKDRPKTWPNSDEPYPYHGSDVLRYGTGWVRGVCRHANEECVCGMCGGIPETDWGHIHVNTATHLVFDAEEGQHTTVELFFDSDQDQRDGSVHQLTHATTGVFRVEEDRCELTYITHDMALIEKLDAACIKRDQLQQIIHNRYTSPGQEKNIQSSFWVRWCLLFEFAFIGCLFWLHIVTSGAENSILRKTLAGLLLLLPIGGFILIGIAHCYSVATRIGTCTSDIMCYEVKKIQSVKVFYLTSDMILLCVVFVGNFVLNAQLSNIMDVRMDNFFQQAIDLLLFCIYLTVASYAIKFIPVLLVSRWYPSAQFGLIMQIKKLRKVLPLLVRLRQPDHKLTIIVSHPHGCSKQVTLGEWTYREEFVGDLVTMRSRYVYTTSTCPGSSGALVYFLGNRLVPILRYSGHAHSRRCVEEGLNMCGGGYDD